MVFKFDDPTLIRTWHIYDMITWFEGFGLNYSGYLFTGIGTKTATITVDGNDFTGSGSNDTEAMGMAFYHFLISPNVSDYLIR